MGVETSTGRVGPFAKIWSLSWQAAPGRNLLVHESMAEKILDRLVDAHRQPGRVLLYYVLMPTEIHVITGIESRESIVGIVRSCSHILSRWVRAAHTSRGPAFAAKCRAALLDSMQSLQSEVLMLAWRPVRSGLCVAPALYPYSALIAGADGMSGHGFDARPLLSVYGEPADVARALLDASLRAQPNDETWRCWELKRGLEQPTAQQSRSEE